MRHLFNIVILTTVSTFLPTCTLAEIGQNCLYVSPAGSDSWSGRFPVATFLRDDGPFKSLEKVRDTIRLLKQDGGLPDGGVTVYLRGGMYPLTKTLELTAEDSGVEGSPIVYQAYETETVRIIGGKEVAGFVPIDDGTVVSRIDPAHRDKIVRADLKSQGITDFGELKPRGFGRPVHPAGLELFFQDRPMQLARWPNTGWVKIAATPGGKDAGKFQYEGDRPKRWVGAEEIWLHGYWTYDWADTYEKVKSIDTQAREITTCKPHGAYGYTTGKRYYALNILAELEAPGEWWLDRDSGMLYFWPPAPINEGRAFVSVLEQPMISMLDVSHIKLQGLTLECTRGTAVKIIGGGGNVVSKCTFRNIGNVAVNISGGTDNGICGCEIHETGDGGVILSGGDRKTLVAAGNYACNNHIHHYSRWARSYRPAIRISGVGNRIAHNLIHDGPHTAVLFCGNDHMLEFNEVHNVCYETGDVGAFYTGRDWTTRGTVIRHNYFHDISGPYTHGAMAVYLDDAASGTTIFGNVFYKASRAAFIGGGRDNVVENNIFVQCHPAVHIDARGLGWAKKYIARGGGWHMYEKLNAMSCSEPPYSARYPKLATILQDDPAVPKGNVVRRNVCSGGRWLDLQGVDRNIVTIEDNLLADDPGFVDYANADLRLRSDSAAYRIGFKQIPMERIGLTRGRQN
ncbi:MAG: right-handed parallel beta-helix repeat-containing protein [Phycisphaerales bacterium]|nr:MAG: right-handed parallel beta-helix repeat-containing protein [Phycisphaerales bacterium]